VAFDRKEKIIVIGGNEDRVHVKRVGNGMQTATLKDPNLDDDSGEIYIETGYQGSNGPIQFTVTKQLAINAVLEYLHNHTLSIDLVWVGK
jgi:hypothetical protein